MDRKSITWTSERLARFWDYQSQRPSALRNYFSAGHGRWIVERTLRYFPKKEPTASTFKVLDLGCGAGYLLRRLAEQVSSRPIEFVGADFSLASIDKSKSEWSNTKAMPQFVHISHYPMLFPASSFDVVYSIEVVEHLYDDMLSEMLREVHRVLRPGGVFFVTTPNNEDLEQMQTSCPNCESIFHIWQHVRSWTAESLTAEIESRGFLKVYCEPTILESRLTRIAFAIGRKLGVIRRNFPHLFGVFKKYEFPRTSDFFIFSINLSLT